MTHTLVRARLPMRRWVMLSMMVPLCSLAQTIDMRSEDPMFNRGVFVNHVGVCESEPTLLLSHAADAVPEATSLVLAAKTAASDYQRQCPTTRKIRFAVDNMPENRHCASADGCYIVAERDGDWEVDINQLQLVDNLSPVRDVDTMTEALAAGRFDLVRTAPGLFSHYFVTYFLNYSDQCSAHIKDPVRVTLREGLEVRDSRGGLVRTQEAVSILIERPYESLVHQHSALALQHSMGPALTDPLGAARRVMEETSQFERFLSSGCTADRVLTVQQNLIAYARGASPVTGKYSTRMEAKPYVEGGGPSAPAFIQAYTQSQRARAQSQVQAMGEPPPRTELPSYDSINSVEELQRRYAADSQAMRAAGDQRIRSLRNAGRAREASDETVAMTERLSLLYEVFTKRMGVLARQPAARPTERAPRRPAAPVPASAPAASSRNPCEQLSWQAPPFGHPHFAGRLYDGVAKLPQGSPAIQFPQELGAERGPACMVYYMQLVEQNGQRIAQILPFPVSRPYRNPNFIVDPRNRPDEPRYLAAGQQVAQAMVSAGLITGPQRLNQPYYIVVPLWRDHPLFTGSAAGMQRGDLAHRGYPDARKLGDINGVTVYGLGNQGSGQQAWCCKLVAEMPLGRNDPIIPGRSAGNAQMYGEAAFDWFRTHIEPIVSAQIPANDRASAVGLDVDVYLYAQGVLYPPDEQAKWLPPGFAVDPLSQTPVDSPLAVLRLRGSRRGDVWEWASQGRPVIPQLNTLAEIDAAREHMRRERGSGGRN